MKSKMEEIVEDFTIIKIFEEIPKAFYYYVLGSFIGIISTLILFLLDKNILEKALLIWRKRLLFGAEIIGPGGYIYWFIVNNLFVMMVIIVGSMYVLITVSNKPKKRFFKFEESPKITLFGIYMIPKGALLINGFVVSLFATYMFLNYGTFHFLQAVSLLLPHGASEIMALILACSLGLSYLKEIEPFILQKKNEEAIEIGKNLMKTDDSLYVIIIIITLVAFSGFIEGSLSSFLI